MSKTTITLIVLIPVAIMNIVSYAMMSIDKKRAEKGEWRIPEATLFLVTALFGGLGGVMAMKIKRHKTKHWYFKLFFPLLLILQIALLAVGAYFLFK